MRLRVLIRRAYLLLLALVGLFGPPDVLSTSEAEPLAGTVSFDPPTQEVCIGMTGTVEVRSDDLSNIYGAQFTLTFDADQLQVVDADGNAGNGVQISTGSCPAPDFLVTNTADNMAGIIEYAAVQLAPRPVCAGGVIASIEFLCLDTPGSSFSTLPITITESVVSDPDGTPIAHGTEHGQIVCRPCYLLTGAVEPQGHPADAAGVEVCLEGSGCETTAVDGTFSLWPETSGPYTVTADVVGHLSARKTSIPWEAGVHIGTTMLRAGDLNEDGVINILDLVMVGGNFGLEEPTEW